MRIKRIELEGSHGSATIERAPGSTTIRIDSIIRNPAPAPGNSEQAWKTWELPARCSDEQVLDIAETIQRRCDGVRGTHSDIHDYARELWRFAD